MSEKEFTYDRIDMDRPSFRLMRLLGAATTDIHCELFEAYLDESNDGGIPYEALSYTWGDNRKNGTIQINGMKSKVTENLFIALHHLRPVDGYRILWIDAVCIDQGHDKEKGHQVQQMGRIYQTAERVIVWLGIGSEDSDSLMDFLNTLPSNSEMHPTSQLVPHNLQAQYRESMKKLLQRPWFRRVWIIQEVAKAQRATIFCGWRSVSTRVFTNAPSLLGLELDGHSKSILDVMPGHLRARNWYNEQPTLCTLLQNFHRSEATDKRDMIYALVGMSSSVHEQIKLQADYEKDLQELIRDTTSTLLFPELNESPDLHYIHWNWSEFIDNLEDLRTAAFLCALRDPTSEPEPFIGMSWHRAQWGSNAVRYRDTQGHTLLWIAAEYGREGIINILLEQDGFDINAKSKQGGTPLHIAMKQGHESIVRLLVEHNGINTNATDEHNATPLHIATQQGHEGIVRLLVEHGGININAVDEHKETPLHIAAKQGHEDILRLLVEHDGININAKDEYKELPLHKAAKQGYESIVRLLVRHDGIDINTKDVYGRTPLWAAAKNGHEGVVKLMLEQHRTDVNERDHDGVTPSQIAERQGYEGIVRLLGEQHRTDVNEGDQDGVTPSHIAERRGYKGIVRRIAAFYGRRS